VFGFMSGNSDIPIFIITLNLSQAAVLSRIFLEFFIFFLTRPSNPSIIQQMAKTLNHLEQIPTGLVAS